MTNKKNQLKDEEGIEELKSALEAAERHLRKAKQILWLKEQEPKIKSLKKDKDGKIVEGVFDGRFMIDKNGKKYPVNENYASKSKLVTGDVLKLTILEDGSFIYKQIKPIERTKAIGVLEKDGDCFAVKFKKKQYQILSASVHYFKANEGDKVTIIIPKQEKSEWAAVENRL